MECSICLEQIDERRILTTQCGHNFHISCLKKWLRMNDSCPVCRNDLIDIDFIEVDEKCYYIEHRPNKVETLIKVVVRYTSGNPILARREVFISNSVKRII